MSRLFSVIVLCPNGRREMLKISSNSSILQVLEEACVKQKLKPEDYDLLHYKKILDLSLPIRFANLPNNALLELHPSKSSRKDCMVTIALQLESGERLMRDFTPTSTLLDVLKQSLETDSFISQEKGEPVCIYMRQKITGDAIKTTTLRSLGLTQGTAIIRLLYRKPEELESQAHVSSPLTASITTEPVSTQDRHLSSNFTVPASTSKTECFEDSKHKTEFVYKTESNKYEKETTCSMDIDYNKNGIEKILSDSERNKDLPVPLNEIKTENVTTVDNQKVKKEFDLDAKNVEEISVVNFVNDTVKMECDLDVKEEFEEIGNINYIGERHAVLYSLEDITDIKKADLPDEFFELTVSDVRYMLEEYKRERIQMENQPLLTKEQRERQILQKLACYSQTVIRVYFPERLVLQAVFNATETVQTVCDFLKNYLENKDLNFYLYTTPPKEKLSNTKNLLESMLVPAAVVYFGCDTQIPNYLLNNLREMKSDPRAAALAASESRRGDVSSVQYEIPPPSTNVSVKLENPSENVSTSVNEFRQSNVNQPKPEKIPKWMKLSRK